MDRPGDTAFGVILAGVLLLLLWKSPRIFHWIKTSWWLRADRRVATIRFASLYCLYLAILYPFVNVDKSEGLWWLGALFAAAGAYVWGQIRPLPKGGNSG